MKRSQKVGMWSMLVAAFWVLLCTSCIREDRDDCPATVGHGVKVNFRYTYNIVENDAFGKEAENVRVWIFDEEGKFVSMQEDEGDHIVNGYTLALPSLSVGKYKLVAWAKSMDYDDELSEFSFPDLIAGQSTVSDLTAYLNRDEDNVCSTRLNGLLSGTLDVEVTGAEEEVFTIDMMKCTNTLRVILMPARAGQTLYQEDYSFVIDGKNGWLDYKADLYGQGEVTYKPYYQELLRDETASGESRADDAEINHAVVAELNTSRMMVNQGPRFRIINNRTGKDVLDINLTWFLSLQAVGEHRAEWDDQEYLDRQDTYAVTFFVDGDTFLQNYIIVNGWVISLEDVTLG
ncbi:FimB/Mfa2 family fimbrial subunit [Phocaeicola plebeius]|uniref:FimB/Mfa2 family fimbrial subunit n=1 Tax=Phocaeicola plebeius TaxID=310297 RepID=UPI0026DB9CDF|nr:FimB/Mfa2 family fimbrial subunit [Phocaeicola plebeius]